MVTPTEVRTIPVATAPRRGFGPVAEGWLVAFVCLLPFVLTSYFGADEFQFLYEAKQMAQGAVPYRDFWEFIMPGSLMLAAAAFKLAGPTLLAARLLQAAVLAGLAVACWRLSRALGAGRFLAPLPAMALMWVMVPRWLGFSHHWFAQAGVGLTLALTWWALGQKRDAAWGAVGLAVGATYAMQQLDGAALVVGLGAGLLWTAWRQRWGLKRTVVRAGWFVAGMGAPLALLAAYFAAQGALPTAAWATHVWPLGQYRAAGNHNDVSFAGDLWNEVSPQIGWINRPYWAAGVLLALVGTCLPVAVALAGLSWLAGLKRDTLADDRRVALAGIMVLVTGALFLAACRGRADLTHVMLLEAPCFVLWAAAAGAWERFTAGQPWAIGVRFLPRLALAAVVAAGLFRVAEVAHRSPDAWLRLEAPDARIQAQPALRAIAPALIPGDTLLTAPIGAVFYFYLAPNATRYSYWVRPEDGYTTPAQHREILASVAEHKPRFLLVTTGGGRNSADQQVRELLDRYTFQRTLPYPAEEPRVTFEVYVYQRKP